MAKDIKIKFTIDGIEQEVNNLKDFNKAMKDAGETTKETAEEATIFGDLKGRFKDLTAPIRKVITSMKTLKGAIAATGIGALIVAFGTLIAYFKSSEEGSKKLAIATETLSLLFGKLTDFAAGVGEKIVGAFSNPMDSLKQLANAIKDNIIERFRSLLEVLGFVGSALKKFFTGDFKGALADVKEAGTEMVDVFTGVDGTVQKVGETATKVFKEVKKAVAEATVTATKLVEATRALRDQQQRLTVENAELNQELELQRKIAEDTTLTYEERKSALEQVGQTQIELAANVAQQAKAEEDLLKLQIANESNYEKREELETQLAEATAARIDAQTQLSIVEQEAGKLGRELEQEELDRKRSIRDLLRDAAQQDLEDAFAQARAELDIQQQAALEELDNLKATEAEKEAIKKSFGAKRMALDKEEAEFKKKLNQAQLENDLALASGALGAITQLAGEGSAAAKAAAIAQTTVDTYVGAQKAYTSQLVPGDPTSPIRAAIAAGIAVASGIANVKAILSTKTPGGDGASGGSSPQRPSIPSFTPDTFDPTQAGGAGETITLAQEGTQPVVKAYVVAEEVSSQQEANKRIDDLSRL